MTPAVGLTGYNSLTPNDEAAVMQHIAEVSLPLIGGQSVVR